MFIPRGPRKRLLALSELTKLQMKTEEEKAATAIQARTYPNAQRLFLLSMRNMEQIKSITWIKVSKGEMR